MVAIAEIAPATIAAIVETRMSRFLMCPNSCASTPLTSSRQLDEQTVRYRHRGVARVAPGGERVRLV